MLNSFSSVLSAPATPSRAMSVEMRDSDVVSAVTRDTAGFIVPYATLVADLPLLQFVLLPLSKATHVFVVSREARNIPPMVAKLIGHYDPTQTLYGGAPVITRIFDKSRLLVDVCLNGYVGAWCYT